MKSVAILEGWAGGPRLSRALRQALLDNGFRVSKNLKTADIIVAHSTGCYMLPKELRANLVMLIDPPYWPGEPIVERWIRMNKAELKFLRKQQGNLRFATNKLWELYYIFAKPRYTWSVLRNQSHLDFLDYLKDTPLILVRNKADEFCSPKIKGAVWKFKNIRYGEVPGCHGDYYINPKPYIDLLLRELK